MTFIQANSFLNANRGPNDIERLILHTAEIQEERDSAEDVARFFAQASTEVSAHKCIDNNSIVGCVRNEDIAFAALGDNPQSLNYELSGFAKQTFEQWRDRYSRDVIENAAIAAAADCKANGIPLRWLTDAQLKARQRGFCTHQQVSRIFGQGTRTDPGPNFPKDLFLRRTQFHMGQLTKIEFVIADEAATVALAVSTAVNSTDPEARRDRLLKFLTNQIELLDSELAEDRDVVLRRRKA